MLSENVVTARMLTQAIARALPTSGWVCSHYEAFRNGEVLSLRRELPWWRPQPPKTARA